LVQEIHLHLDTAFQESELNQSIPPHPGCYACILP